MEAAPTSDIQQTVQDALRDLLSVASLTHEDSWEVETTPPPAAAPQPCASGTTSGQQRQPSTSASYHEGLLPATEGAELREQDLPPQAMARLYQARLRAAHTELVGLQDAIKSRDAKLSSIEKEVHQLRQEKAAWTKQHKVLETAAERGKRAAEDARARLAEQENALKQVGLERRVSLQERRQTEADTKAREGRLAAALEEAHRLRKLLEDAKAQAAARGGVSREEHARVVAENRQLGAQKQELVLAFKKAGRLIDVMRRQKVHLEAAALLQVSSRELADALQQGQQGQQVLLSGAAGR
ncbi:Testis-expressed protein 9 [Chlorella vulgaris]